jgi:hypothetical protein
MKKSLPLALLPLAFALPTFANVDFGVDFASPGKQDNASVWSLGYQFIANTASAVIGLGTFDYQQTGLVGPQQVGLWNSSGTLLASTFVDNSDPLTGFWRFAPIAPVTLTPGDTYYVASQGGEGYTWLTSGFTVSPNITFVSDAWEFTTATSNNTPLTFPATSDGYTQSEGGGLFGGNIEFSPSATPEPGYFVAVFAGLAGLIAIKRRRRQTHA